MPLFFQMKRFLGSPETDTVAESGVYSTRRFSEMIRNERARCDRYGRCFALVMFHLDDRKKAGPGVRKWIRRLRGRIRPIDALGWIDGNRLAVLLPGTTRSGAECFAGDAGRRGPGPDSRPDSGPDSWPNSLSDSFPAWTVFVYPSAAKECRETDARKTDALDDRTVERT
jgi:hypothetical protein